MAARRALFGLLAVGTCLLPVGAGALSWREATCEEFRSSALEHDAIFRVRVLGTRDHQVGQEGESAEVEARVREALTGRMPRDRTLTYRAETTEISGIQFGYIPAGGDEAILFVDRERDGGLIVKSAMPAAYYKTRWVRRCGF